MVRWEILNKVVEVLCLKKVMLDVLLGVEFRDFHEVGLDFFGAVALVELSSEDT